jgi:hypothetical protein
MAVEQDRRRPGLLQPVAVDVRVDVRDLEHLHVLDPELAHHHGGGLGGALHLARRIALSRDAGDLRELHELALEVFVV